MLKDSLYEARAFNTITVKEGLKKPSDSAATMKQGDQISEKKSPKVFLSAQK